MTRCSWLSCLQLDFGLQGGLFFAGKGKYDLPSRGVHTLKGRVPV